ncbi:hypothetical protein XHV734_1841 [Xanthomonas hortorum pv. vitians]|nr:hypothetical protein XHV734_1841 [Xanthomonas hortorum pv. vitians]
MFVTSMAQGSPQLYWTLTDGISEAITKTVTGDSDSPYEAIDKNLMLMQVAMTGLDQIQTAGDKNGEDQKTRARWFTGIGMAGPGVVAGSMRLLNKIAMALVVVSASRKIDPAITRGLRHTSHQGDHHAQEQVHREPDRRHAEAGRGRSPGQGCLSRAGHFRCDVLRLEVQVRRHGGR